MNGPGELPYRPYSQWIQERLGPRIYKIGLDARFTCPNIDGTVAKGGCTFCTNPSFSFQPLDAAGRRRDLREQLRSGIATYREGRKARGFLAYFQTFTNTYAPPETLRAIYREVLSEPDVVGLAISTRPDCVPEPVLDVLEEMAQDTFVLVEMGLQSANDAILDRINRGHTLEQFHDAMERLARRNLNVKVHLLFGLPTEEDTLDAIREDALESVRQVNASPADGVKLHHLQVLRKTRMGQAYSRNPFRLLGFDEYRELLVEVIGALDPRLYVDRLFATCKRELVIAPHWDLHASQARDRLLEALRERGVQQGDHCPREGQEPVARKS